MRKMLAAIFSMVTLATTAQDLVEFQPDSTFTILLPDNYEIEDSDGTKVIVGRFDHGVVTLTSVGELYGLGIKARDKQDLLSGYETFAKGAVGALKGKMIDYKEITVKSGQSSASASATCLAYCWSSVE